MWSNTNLHTLNMTNAAIRSINLNPLRHAGEAAAMRLYKGLYNTQLLNSERTSTGMTTRIHDAVLDGRESIYSAFSKELGFDFMQRPLEFVSKCIQAINEGLIVSPKLTILEAMFGTEAAQQSAKDYVLRSSADWLGDGEKDPSSGYPSSEGRGKSRSD